MKTPKWVYKPESIGLPCLGIAVPLIVIGFILGSLPVLYAALGVVGVFVLTAFVAIGFLVRDIRNIDRDINKRMRQ